MGMKNELITHWDIRVSQNASLSFAEWKMCMQGQKLDSNGMKDQELDGEESELRDRSLSEEELRRHCRA
jgi:hypothetical protein